LEVAVITYCRYPHIWRKALTLLRRIQSSLSQYVTLRVKSVLVLSYRLPPVLASSFVPGRFWLAVACAECFPSNSSSLT